MAKIVIEVGSLIEAREKLAAVTNVHDVIVQNKVGAEYWLGVKTLDELFKMLQQEFKLKPSQFRMNICDDFSSKVVARKLGYDLAEK